MKERAAMLKRIVVLVVMASMVLAFSAFTASAGEINGKGERPMVVGVVDGHTILHGKSACAFSGLNDEYLAEQPEDGVASDGFGRTQNWGQLSQEDKATFAAFGFHPGQACNPNIGEPGI